MHVADELVPSAREQRQEAYDDVDAVAKDVELVVGDEYGELDEASLTRSRPVISQSTQTMCVVLMVRKVIGTAEVRPRR